MGALHTQTFSNLLCPTTGTIFLPASPVTKPMQALLMLELNMKIGPVKITLVRRIRADEWPAP